MAAADAANAATAGANALANITNAQVIESLFLTIKATVAVIGGLFMALLGICWYVFTRFERNQKELIANQHKIANWLIELAVKHNANHTGPGKQMNPPEILPPS